MASAYAKIISWLGWAVAKLRTVSFTENRTSMEPLCFPITTSSVLQSAEIRGLIDEDD